MRRFKLEPMIGSVETSLPYEGDDPRYVGKEALSVVEYYVECVMPERTEEAYIHTHYIDEEHTVAVPILQSIYYGLLVHKVYIDGELINVREYRSVPIGLKRNLSKMIVRRAMIAGCVDEELDAYIENNHLYQRNRDFGLVARRWLQGSPE